jgi:uncharacterized membrane protein YkoI
MDVKKLAVGAMAVAVLALGGGTALAAQQAPQTQQGQSTTQQEAQDPAIKGTIPAPKDQGNETAEGQNGQDNSAAEAAETQQLQGLAKIDQAAAEKAALAAVPGQIQKTELGDENGFVVYSVEVKGADGTVTDVKVDAGDGSILAQETGEDNAAEQGGDEASGANTTGGSMTTGK